MLFSSLIFIFWFLPIVLAVYFLLKPSYRNYWLTATSLFFYAWGELKYTVVLLVSIIVNYFFGLLLGSLKSRKYKHLALLFGLIFNFGLLAYFKYWNFFLDIFLNIFSEVAIENIPIHLPIGISFFTFQIVTYLVDVYRGKHKHILNILDLTLYISFFPQLIAGPIITFNQIIDQIHHRVITVENFSYGIGRFMLGLSKKVLIANNMAVVADGIFGLSTLPANLAWLGIITYTLQIYFDFSGYSDMAIGLAAMFGFKFPENFNYPYISKSIQEFWRRWHISLSTWFKEYLYIPLGGSRVSTWRIYLNIFIVFTLTGFWHGASWNFLAWGVLNGIFLMVERAFLADFLKKIPPVFSHVYLLFAVTIGWVFFRTNTLNEAFSYISALFGLNGFQSAAQPITNFINNEQLFAFVLGLIFATPVLPWLQNKSKNLMESPNKYLQTLAVLWEGILFKTICFSLFFLSIGYLLLGTYNPFIYFRF